MAEKQFMGDEVIERAMGIAHDVIKSVVQQYPQPAGRKKLTQREQLYRYLTMTPEDKQALMQERGPIRANYYFFEMEKLRGKLGG